MAGNEPNTETMRSQLGRVRGLGSAKEGVAHWWAQRVTALALIPLSLWFLSALLCLSGAEYLVVRNWLSSPVTLTLASLFIVTLTYHGALGLQVVIEDYLQGKAIRVVALLVMKFAAASIGAAGLVSLLMIAFGR